MCAITKEDYYCKFFFWGQSEQCFKKMLVRTVYHMQADQICLSSLRCPIGAKGNRKQGNVAHREKTSAPFLCYSFNVKIFGKNSSDTTL